ncbi:MAG: hypothetical protein CR968_06205 [Flavobacteriia bacterium]|nr:MAG: hypothetical protein CR968_06205 [Flavobacteriia bacterium]
MNIFQKVKSAIDYAIFCTESVSCQKWQGNTPLNLGNELYLCQQKIDGLGGSSSNDKINPRNQAKLDELKSKVKSKILALEKDLSTARGGLKKDLIARIAELKDALKEIELLEKSSTNYDLNIIEQNNPRLTYDDVTDTVTVNYIGTTGNLLNELKHAFQYETGKIEFIKIKNSSGKASVGPGLTYDLGDELETYKRQYAYDGILKLRLVLTEEEMMQELKSGKLKKELGLGYLEIKKMKKITANVIIKVGDGVASYPLYENISKKSLDINSPIGDIIKNNPARKSLSEGLGLNTWDKEKPYIDFIKVYIKEKPFIYVKY